MNRWMMAGCGIALAMTAVAAEALRSVRREKLMGLLPRKVCCCSEMQTYTDGRSEGHLRSREASLIAAGHRHGNIGFRTK